MLRSFHYAVHAAIRAHAEAGRAAAAHAFGGFRLEPWARFWYATVATIFLDAYHATAARARVLPAQLEHADIRQVHDARIVIERPRCA